MPKKASSPFKPIAKEIVGDVDKWIATPVSKVVKGVDSLTRPVTGPAAKLVVGTVRGVEGALDRITGAKGGKKKPAAKKPAAKKPKKAKK